jgi:hypothetical protein
VEKRFVIGFLAGVLAATTIGSAIAASSGRNIALRNQDIVYSTKLDLECQHFQSKGAVLSCHTRTQRESIYVDVAPTWVTLYRPNAAGTGFTLIKRYRR